MLRKVITPILVPFLAVFSISFLMYADFHVRRNVGNVTFEIKRGEGLMSIARRLSELGLLVSPLSFYVFARSSYVNFKAGEYLLEGSISPADVVAIFEKGRMYRRAVTVVPCWTIYHIARELKEQGIVESEEEFIEYSHDKDFLALLGINHGSAEGFLYPDTYYFLKGSDPREVISKMVENFFKKVGPKRIDMGEKKMGFYKALILASIVESEALFEFEKPIISSVYLNRLKIGMPLQADPTVLYGLKIFTRPPRPSDFRIDNAYNTYTRRGLPPTPICNPLVSSIDAVLNPRKTRFLYFVARPDGTHFFSETYEEHLENIRRAREEREGREEGENEEELSNLTKTE